MSPRHWPSSASGPASGSASGPAVGSGGPGPLYALIDAGDGVGQAELASGLLCPDPGRLLLYSWAVDRFQDPDKLKADRQNG